MLADQMGGLVPRRVDALSQGPLPIRARLLYDASCSIAQSGLEQTLARAASDFERGVSACSRNKVSRATFDTEIHEIDGGEFLGPKQLAMKPMSETYAAKGSATWLDQVLYLETRALYKRFDLEPTGMFHLLVVYTDGRHSGAPDEYLGVQRRLARVVERANSCGGILKTRVLVAYIGIGLTEQHHFDACTKRYGIPREWFKWYAAEKASLRTMGTDMSQSISGWTHGEQTIF